MGRLKTYHVHDTSYGYLYSKYQAESPDDALDKYLTESGYDGVRGYAREHGLDPDDIYDGRDEFRVEEAVEVES